MKTKNILFVLFVLLFLNFNLIAQCPDPVHPDYQAMMDLYNSTNGTSWTNKTGWEAGAAGTNCDPCSGWYGVTCNGNGRVIGINLPGNNLTGYISNIYFEELIELYLQQNQIEGTLPEINCAKLQYIEFSTNNFTSINTIFGINAPLLAAYVLGDNYLIGCISSSYNSLCSQGTQVFLGGNPGFDSNSWANFCSNGTDECSYTQLPVNVAVNFPNQICHGDPFDISVNLNGGNPPFDIKLILESDPENHLLEVNGVNSYQHTFTIDPLQTPQAYPNVGSMPNYAVKVGGLTSPDTYVTFIYNDEIGEIPPSGNSEVAQCGSQPCPTSAQISNEYSICDDSPILFTVDINDGTPPFHIAVHAINTLTNQDNIIVGEFNGQLGSNSYIINPGDANYLINGEYQIRTKINNSNGFDLIFLCMPEFSILSPNNLIITEGFGMACQPTNATSNSVGSCTLNLTQNDTYTLEWDGQSTGSLILTGQLLSIPDLSVGSYFLTVTNSQGCIKTCDFEIRFDNGGIGCQHPDYSELMKLYNSTGGPNWKRNGTVSEPNSTISGWNKDCDICNWYGVRCNTNNRVICIDLDGIDNCKWDFNSGNNNMIGTIPALSFEEVEFFNLSNNGLFGSLSGLNLPKVESLNITDSKLTGSIPNFNQVTLKELRLQFNQLSGSIPELDLPNLKILDFGGNQLNGTIPNLELQNLEELSLGTNQLEGEIPELKFPKMKILYLHKNKFEGFIPSLDMPLLNLFWLNDNKLSGCIPSIFKQNCNTSTNADISSNQLLGNPSWADFCNNDAGICKDSIVCLHPDYAELIKLFNSTGGLNWFKNGTNSSPNSNTAGWGRDCDVCEWYGIECKNNRVVSIDLDGQPNGVVNLESDGNNLIGFIPQLKLNELITLNLSDNKFTGSFNIDSLPKLENLILASCNLSGEFPKLSNQSLRKIFCQYNAITGNLPLFNNLDLKIIDLGGNQIEGNIPNYSFPNLEELYLGFNKLTGSLPEFNLPELKNLWISENQLTGEIPNWNFEKVQQIVLFNNKLTGSIPSFRSLFLNDLNLHSNKLEGNLPTLKTTYLRYLDLHNNNLDGCIPLQFKTYCTTIDYADISNNPLLVTQSWDAFCNDNEGICCFKPLVQGFSITGSIDEVNEVELKNYGLYPEISSLKIIEIRNNQLNQYNCSEDGILSYSFGKHFFGEVEVIVEACGLDCNECDTMVVKISDAYLPYIHPTNAFTPNVGTNQTLRFNDDDNIPESELFIYNRWGDRIYYAKDYTNDWDADGYPGGIYFYVLKVQDVILKSTLTIIK